MENKAIGEGISKFLIHINNDGSITVFNEKYNYSCFFSSEEGIVEDDARIQEIADLEESQSPCHSGIQHMLIGFRKIASDHPTINRFSYFYDWVNKEYNVRVEGMTDE